MFFFPNVTLDTYYLTVFLVPAIFILLFLLVKKTPIEEYISPFIGMCMTIVSTGFLVFFFFGVLITNTMLDVAKTHGLVKNLDTNRYDITLNEIRTFNTQTPDETKIDVNNFDALRGKIVIVYRYDCSDCRKLYPALEKLQKENPNIIIFLSSRTKNGLAFKDYFKPELVKVPSGIYIRSDGVPVTLELYESNAESESVIFNTANWERLLNIRTQDLKQSQINFDDQNAGDYAANDDPQIFAPFTRTVEF